jgi:hypothetical protein
MITGSSRSEVTTRPSAVRSDDLLAVTQDLVREIDAVLVSKGIRTRLCDTNIVWHARRVRELLTANRALCDKKGGGDDSG